MSTKTATSIADIGKKTIAVAKFTADLRLSNRAARGLVQVRAPAFRVPYSLDQQSGIPTGRAVPVPMALFVDVEPTVLLVFPDDVPLAASI